MNILQVMESWAEPGNEANISALIHSLHRSFLLLVLFPDFDSSRKGREERGRGGGVMVNLGKKAGGQIVWEEVAFVLHVRDVQKCTVKVIPFKNCSRY